MLLAEGSRGEVLPSLPILFLSCNFILFRPSFEDIVRVLNRLQTCKEFCNNCNILIHFHHEITEVCFVGFSKKELDAVCKKM